MELSCFHNKHLHLLSTVKVCYIKITEDNIVHKIVHTKPTTIAYEFSADDYSRYKESSHEYIEPFRNEYKVSLYDLGETTSISVINTIVQQLGTIFEELHEKGRTFDFGAKVAKVEEILCKLTFSVDLSGNIECFFRNFCVNKHKKPSAHRALFHRLLIYFMYRGKSKDRINCHVSIINGHVCKLRGRKEYFVKYDYRSIHEIICNVDLNQ